MNSNPSYEQKTSAAPSAPSSNQKAEAFSRSDRLTPSEIESLRNEGKRAMRVMMEGREHLIV